MTNVKLGHMKPALVVRTIVPSNDLCHMTKMATMPIYGSNTVNNFFSIISGSFNYCIETQYMYVAMPTQTFHSVFEL